MTVTITDTITIDEERKQAKEDWERDWDDYFFQKEIENRKK